MKCYAEKVSGTSLEGRRHIAGLEKVQQLSGALPKLLVSDMFFNPMFHIALNNHNYDYEFSEHERKGRTKDQRRFLEAWDECSPMERAIAMSLSVMHYEPELEWTS